MIYIKFYAQMQVHWKTNEYKFLVSFIDQFQYVCKFPASTPKGKN